MNAYQLITIFFESVNPARDIASYQQWFDLTDQLNEKLPMILPQDAFCRRLMGGTVMIALPEQEILDKSTLERSMKPQVEKILGPQYIVKILYTNFLVPENTLENMTQHAIDQYEHLTDPSSTMVLLDLGHELPEIDANENLIDVAKNMLQNIEDGRFESTRMMFLQVITMFRFRRSGLLTHMFMGASMSMILMLSGWISGANAEADLRLVTDSVIGPDWQNYVLGSLEEICRKHRNYRSTRFDSFELRVHEFVNRDITNSKLDLKKTAENFGLTPTYFSQVFKEHMGIGFQAYVEQLRMQIGYDLLRQRDMTVTRAARECGYENVGTFRRNFKKHFGINPGDIMM